MSKNTNRDTAARGVASLDTRLARLLDTQSLARVVPHLAPETLHQLIRHRGLDACGELVTSATPAQLTVLLDLDLWRSPQPGRDERFDADRFGEWLEVLADAGHSAAARTVAALDTHLVAAGLSRYVRVFDPGIFEPTAQSDDEPTDRREAMREGDALHGDDPPGPEWSRDWIECEVGGYLVRARRADAWDAIVSLLGSLDGEHADYFHALMRECRRLSNSRSEIDGLDELLQPPEQHFHDVAIAREHRRSQHGYATPADARAFLEMARQPTPRRSAASQTRSSTVSPIVTAYFRAAADAPASSNATDVPESLEAVVELPTEAGMMPERSRALLVAADADPQPDRFMRLRRLMASVHDTDETAYLTRGRELAFLANTLLAGCSVQSRPFTPQEASDAAAGICNLGLEYWPARWSSPPSTGASSPPRSETATAAPPNTFPPDALLVDHDLVTAFEVGWSVLYQDVSLFAVEQLISTLAHVDCVDRDIRRGLVELRRALVKQRDVGTPWRARHALEILAQLDMTAWISVLGLLDECPILPAALTAVLEGRTSTVSATEFAFISTAAQIGDVRRFMQKLPALLSG